MLNACVEKGENAWNADCTATAGAKEAQGEATRAAMDLSAARLIISRALRLSPADRPSCDDLLGDADAWLQRKLFGRPRLVYH